MKPPVPLISPDDPDFAHVGGTTYLDHAGATIAPQSQVRAAAEEIATSLLGNPHSAVGCVSQDTARRVADVRARVLAFFGVDSSTHVVVFTANATAAIKLVGECFPWAPGGRFLYHLQSHTSVLGIRDLAMRAGSEFDVLAQCKVPSNGDAVEGTGSTFQVDTQSNQLSNDQLVHNELRNDTENDQSQPSSLPPSHPQHLVAIPAECNFSGERLHDVATIVKQIKEGRPQVRVLLDAAKFAATSPLDLSTCPADFIAVSFYKIMGFPTGLGALVMTHDAAQSLAAKPYFGGGTVDACSARTSFRALRPFKNSNNRAAERFEDGTLPFSTILALRHGLDRLKQVGMARISAYTFELAQYMYHKIRNFEHYDGSPVCEFYGQHSQCDASVQGGIVAFNVLRPTTEYNNGEDSQGSETLDTSRYVGYAEVNRMATLHNIQMRVGCFCNPGACQRFLDISEEDVRAHHRAGHVCWDDSDLVDGKPRGAVRVSFGYMSHPRDVDAFIKLLQDYFVVHDCPLLVGKEDEPQSTATIKTAAALRIGEINVFPIKSCRAMAVQSWPLSSRGLLFDREWAVVDSQGNVLNQKVCATMSLIVPTVDEEGKRLHIRYVGEDASLLLPSDSHELTIELDELRVGAVETPTPPEITECQVQGNGEVRLGMSLGDWQGRDRVDKWFTSVLGRSCRLVRQHGGGTSFVNEGSILAVMETSVADVQTRLSQMVLDKKKAGDQDEDSSSLHRRDLMSSFRANLVVVGDAPAYSEDDWAHVYVGRFGEQHADLEAVAACSRCTMVNIDQTNATKSSGPLLTLAKYRRQRSKILFGRYLQLVPSLSAGFVTVCVGDDVSTTVVNK